VSELLLHEIFEREDGLFQVSLADDAPCFRTRQFALRVASGRPPRPAPVVKFRHYKIIREVHSDAP